MGTAVGMLLTVSATASTVLILGTRVNGCHGDDDDEHADDVDGSVDAEKDDIVDESHVSEASSLVHAPFLVVVCSL